MPGGTTVDLGCVAAGRGAEGAVETAAVPDARSSGPRLDDGVASVEQLRTSATDRWTPPQCPQAMRAKRSALLSQQDRPAPAGERADALKRAPDRAVAADRGGRSGVLFGCHVVLSGAEVTG